MKTPPASTAAVASPGAPSLRRNAASIWLNRNSGTTNLTGSRYCCASGSSASRAPNRRSSGASKNAMASQLTAAKNTVPASAAVKYSLPSFCLPAPRAALSRTEPPMPVSSPRL